MTTQFPDVKPFPQPAAAIGHNRPPLDAEVVLDFEEAVKTSGLLKRINDLIASAGRAGDCDSEDKAGKFGDLIKMIRAAERAVEAERERLNRPILTAQRALKGRADAYVGDLSYAERELRRRLDAYMAEQRRIAVEERRKSEEAARTAAEARRAAEQGAPDRASKDDAESAEVAEYVAPEPVEIDEPVVRGDAGSRIGSTTVWLHKVVSVRKLPDAILTHEKVRDAIDKVIAAQVRGGAREIKGVEIWSEQRTAVR
jgi:hypothetical protein